MNLTGILVAYSIFFVGIFSPGPNILAVINTSMSVDRPSGKALAMGIASGSFLWGMLAWLGLTSLLVAFSSLMVLIKITGAVYLFWLAIKAFRSAATRKELVAQKLANTSGLYDYYRRGLIIQMTNPKAALTWTATMALGLSPSAPWWIGGIIVFGTTIISFVGHIGYAVAFSTRPMVNTYLRARRWIEASLGIFFCFASYKLLTSKN
ncbi:LysE family translocator [Kiloniella laminariae]|uniref:LysE family translocator n=1 Tax=Kiloniella laminariae TaxID=454162 RepID=UPI0003A16060|nr:LysE family translocator [Kiloniella laminariae]